MGIRRWIPCNRPPSKDIHPWEGDEGWEYEITADNTDSTIRMFIKGYTMYTLEVARKEGKDFSEKRDEFFDSFRLTDDY